MTGAPEVILPVAGAPEEVGLSSAGLDRVEAIVAHHVRRGVIAGAVTLTARHGSVARAGVYGVNRRFPRRPLRRDAIFHVFSMTKPVTGLAMSILADRGLWHPDDLVARHLPELSGLRVMAGDGVARKAGHQPTMRELMTHMAGFSYGRRKDDPVDALYAAADLVHSAGLDDFVARLSGLPLAYQPGTEWRYSVATDIQGAVVERLTGRRFADFLHEVVFEPLGMTDTAFFVPPGKRRRLAQLHFSGRGIRLFPVRNPVFRDPVTEPALTMGGMGLYSTVDDYARFAQLLLNGGQWAGRRIVSEEALRAQMTNYVPEHLLARRFSMGQMHFRPGFGYGYDGAVVYDPVAAGLPVGRGSYFWDGLAGTWFWVDPEHDLLYVGMIQLLSYTAPPLQRLTQTAMAGAILDS